MDCSPPTSSVHGIPPAGILEWVATPFTRARGPQFSKSQELQEQQCHQQPWLALFHGKVKVKVAQSCWTLCDPVDCTVQGILQARILEWVAFPFSRGSSQPRDRTQVSLIVGGFFTCWATREAMFHGRQAPNPQLLVGKIPARGRPVFLKTPCGEAWKA